MIFDIKTLVPTNECAPLMNSGIRRGRLEDADFFITGHAKARRAKVCPGKVSTIYGASGGRRFTQI